MEVKNEYFEDYLRQAWLKEIALPARFGKKINEQLLLMIL